MKNTILTATFLLLYLYTAAIASQISDPAIHNKNEINWLDITPAMMAIPADRCAVASRYYEEMPAPIVYRTLRREDIVVAGTHNHQQNSHANQWRPPCDCIPIMAKPSYVKNKQAKESVFGGIVLPPGVTPESIARLSTRKDFDDLSQTTVDNKAGTAPTEGTYSIPVLLVEFPNLSAPDELTVDVYEDVFNSINYLDGNGISVSEYYKHASYDKLNITFDIYDWRELPQTYTYYRNNTHQFVLDTLNAFGTGSDAIDFTQYDSNDNGRMDGIVIVQAGLPGQESAGHINTSAAIYNTTNNFSFQGKLFGNAAIVAARHRTPAPCYGWINFYNYPSDCRTKIDSVVHEFAHVLGLPDLYEINYNGNVQGLGLAGQTVMVQNLDSMQDIKRPINFSAWEKFFLGWLEPTVINTESQSGVYNFGPYDTENSAYILHNPDTMSPREFFLIVNRYISDESLDKTLFGTTVPNFNIHGGLDIYHVDENYIDYTYFGPLAVNSIMHDPDGDYYCDEVSHPGIVWEQNILSGSYPHSRAHNDLYTTETNPVPGCDPIIFKGKFDNIERIDEDCWVFRDTTSSSYLTLDDSGIRVYALSPSGEYMNAFLSIVDAGEFSADISNPQDGSTYNVEETINFTSSYENNIGEVSCHWRYKRATHGAYLFLSNDCNFSKTPLEIGMTLKTEYNIKLIVTDELENVSEKIISINIDYDDLVADITSPADGSVYGQDDIISFEGTYAHQIGDVSCQWAYAVNDPVLADLSGGINKDFTVFSTDCQCDTSVGELDLLPGNYLIQFKVTDGLSRTATDLINIVADYLLYYDLSLLSQPEEGGSVSGEGSYHEGESVPLSAIPAAGYLFLEWTDQDGSTISTVPEFDYFMPDHDQQLTAHFELETFMLSLIAMPATGGTAHGEGSYVPGESVSVSAVAADGYLFVEWTDQDGSTISTVPEFDYFMPDYDQQLTAHFELETFMLSLIAQPDTAGTTHGEGSYVPGESVSVSAVAADGYLFLEWTDQDGEPLSSEPEFDYLMPDYDQQLTAHFELETFMLSLIAMPATGGTAHGEGSYVPGESVSVSAVAADGYLFLEWTDQDGEPLSSEPEFDYLMPDYDQQLTAHFELETFMLSLIAMPATGGTAHGEGSYVSGESVSVSAVAADGYLFLEWTDQDGEPLSSEPEFDYLMPDYDQQLTAHFELETFMLSLIAMPATGGTAHGEGSYVPGESVSVSAVAADGYLFLEWTDQDGEPLSSEPEFDYLMPDYDQQLTAHFELETFMLSLIAMPATGGTAHGEGSYVPGESVSVSAVAADGYLFLEWTDQDGSSISSMPDFTYVMPGYDQLLTAHFDEVESSVAEASPAAVRIFPNPAKNSFTVESEGIISGITITSVTGHRLFTKEINAKHAMININFAPGISLVHVHTKEGIFIKKLIVE